MTASTGGSDSDPDGYTVTLDGGTSQSLGVNGSTTFTDVPEGDHTLELSGLAPACAVDGSNPVQATVTGGQTTDVTVTVGCYQLYFSTGRNGNDDLYRLETATGSQVQITSDASDDLWPALSPDGAFLAFSRGGDIYVANADGSGEVNVTPGGGNDYAPEWSPDGSRIAFTADRNGGLGEIWIMDPDGSNQVNLTNNPASDFDPAWLSDGSKIAFVSRRDGDNEVYVMEADGSNPQNAIQRGGSEEATPAWRP